MSFICPDVQDTLSRWRKLLIGTGLIALGAYCALGVGGLLDWVGVAGIVAGAALGVIGIQRARFRATGHWPGVVVIDEGGVTYMGPITGGSVTMAELDLLVLDPSGHPAHWVLQRNGQTPMHIPVNAEGAGQLFDVFALLPGIRTNHMLTELHRENGHPVVIWERNPDRPAPNRLH